MERSWDVVEEGADGRLKNRAVEVQRARKRQLDAAGRDGTVERGMIRYLYLVLDRSRAMRAKDMRPTRLEAATDLLCDFIREFFDQNPISQLGVIVSHGKVARKLTDLGGAPEEQARLLRGFAAEGGELSLQNSLEQALAALEQIPVYGSREVVVLTGSLGTCDPGDIFETAARLRRARIRVSFVSMAAEMYVCRRIADETAGTYAVALKQTHLRELLFRHVVPMPTPPEQRGGALRKWVRMGFPRKTTDTTPSMCACHRRLTYTGYSCPKCQAKCCELPTDCPVCGLTLISSPHLARSYHHLFSVAPYAEQPQPPPGLACFACVAPLGGGDTLVVACPSCRRSFCAECDVFVHEALHNCPGCEALHPVARGGGGGGGGD